MHSSIFKRRKTSVEQVGLHCAFSHGNLFIQAGRRDVALTVADSMKSQVTAEYFAGNNTNRSTSIEDDKAKHESV